LHLNWLHLHLHVSTGWRRHHKHLLHHHLSSIGIHHATILLHRLLHLHAAIHLATHLPKVLWNTGSIAKLLRYDTMATTHGHTTAHA
jgi:hypothetical protein